MRTSSTAQSALFRPCLLALYVAAVVLSGVVAAAPPDPGQVLARVDVVGRHDALGVPAYAFLTGADGREWALVVAPPAALANVRGAWQVFDTAESASAFVVALERRPGARAAARDIVAVLHDDGRHIVARASHAQAEALAEAGFDLLRLPARPMELVQRSGLEAPAAVVYDPVVADMMAGVTAQDVSDTDGALSGETPVVVGGTAYTIATRNTNQATPIQKATQYTLERFQALGLSSAYHNWSNGGYSNRNVVATQPGSTLAGEVVLVTAHLDDMPSGALAPGADDNASGSTGVLLAAEALSAYQLQRTIRYVLFTGEEQGLLGSEAYADLIASQGANVVAVLNLDMIAWDSTGGPTLRLHTRSTGSGGYAADKAIADTFKGVVTTYGVALSPIDDPDGSSGSDHYSFWSVGYPGILAIEDDASDFCAHYHTVDDTLATLNLTYFTNYVKASVGTTAHLAGLQPCTLSPSPFEAGDADRWSGSGTSSNVNSVLEPGETALVAPTWTYPECSGRTITGTVTSFTGPAGATYTVADPSASYGLMLFGQRSNCHDGSGDCYALRVEAPAGRPALHWHATYTETLSSGASQEWSVHVGASFADVAPTNQMYVYIERLLHNGVTEGCGAGAYCPTGNVTRAQMAMFIARAMAGGDGTVPASGTVPGRGDYSCGTSGVSLFGDVAAGASYCRHVHYIAARGVTSGCGDGTVFCPASTVTRAQMAMFIARAMAGGDIHVPIAYTDVTTGRAYDCQLDGDPWYWFEDAVSGTPMCRYPHYLWARGVADGCTGAPHPAFCMTPPVNRAAMAKFLANGFALGLE